MFDINEGEILTKINRYHLQRGNRHLWIDIHQIIAPEAEHNRFVAIPSNLLFNATKEYEGSGNSEVEALKDCLARIKDESNDIIMPRCDWDKHIIRFKDS